MPWKHAIKLFFCISRDIDYKNSEKGFYDISCLLMPHLEYSAWSVITQGAAAVCSCHEQAKLLREGYGNALILIQGRLIPYCMKNMNGIWTTDIIISVWLWLPSWSGARRNPEGPLYQRGRSELPAVISCSLSLEMSLREVTPFIIFLCLGINRSSHFFLYPANNSFMHPALFVLLGGEKLASPKTCCMTGSPPASPLARENCTTGRTWVLR